jgi:hypothetical protein
MYYCITLYCYSELLEHVYALYAARALCQMCIKYSPNYAFCSCLSTFRPSEALLSCNEYLKQAGSLRCYKGAEYMPGLVSVMVYAR